MVVAFIFQCPYISIYCCCCKLILWSTHQSNRSSLIILQCCDFYMVVNMKCRMCQLLLRHLLFNCKMCMSLLSVLSWCQIHKRYLLVDFKNLKIFEKKKMLIDILSAKWNPQIFFTQNFCQVYNFDLLLQALICWTILASKALCNLRK